MTRGVVIFGVNNHSIDYVKLAMICAGMIKKNMPGNDVCLITDKNSLELSASRFYDLKIFDDIVTMDDFDIEMNRFGNTRRYRDTVYHHFEDQFKNETRSAVYNLSPYDETLLVDADFLVMNSSLNFVWGSDNEIMINHKAKNLRHDFLDGNEFRLNPYGIKMYWATLIYFKKCEKSKLLFSLVEHIKENWGFYEMLYELPGRLYRNDYAFSIAIHMLNGFVESDDTVVSFPFDEIITALDFDQIYKVDSKDSILFFVNDKNEQWKFYATRLNGINVHCMNKISILNQADNFFEVLSD